MEKTYDVVVIGGGPAGLTAALYAGRANLDVLVIEKAKVGSLVSAHKIDNYPGFMDGITGPELNENMKRHAERFGAEVVEGTFLELDTLVYPRIVKTDVKNYKARAVVLSTGWPKNNSAKIAGEEEFVGKGVSYCATCDGAFTRNLTVSVFGQGDEAAEEAMFLTKYSKAINIYVPDAELKCESEVLNLLKENEKVNIIPNVELKEIEGTQFVEKVKFNENGVEKEANADYAFLYIGTKSNKEMFSMIANTDEKGYVITDENMQTLVEGVYAAGDVRAKDIRQITTAVSDGTIAGVNAIKFVLKKKKEES